MGRLGSVAGPLLAAALIGAGQAPQQVLLALLPIIAIGGLTCLWLASRPTATD
jgi:AAHS family 3-hydroxyphenylpropionic acid transporter